MDEDEFEYQLRLTVAQVAGTMTSALIQCQKREGGASEFISQQEAMNLFNSLYAKIYRSMIVMNFDILKIQEEDLPF